MDLNSPDTWRWIWLAAAVGFAVGEIAVAGSFFLLPFALGAAAGAVVNFAGGSVGLAWLAFVVISAACTAVLRPLARRLDRDAPKHGTGADRWVGREAYVVRDIPAGAGGIGLIRLDREEWRAESDQGRPIKAGSTVLVNQVTGTRLIVSPVEDPSTGLPDERGA